MKTRILLAWLALVAVPIGAAEQLSYELLGKKPHSRQDFVQGLEIRDGHLYQGTGLRGRSELQVFDLESGTLLQRRKLPWNVFGEGITVMGDRIVQLTWQQRKGLVFRRDNLARVTEFPLPGEGWGLSNDGERLIYSDGSNILRFISPRDWRVTGSLPVTRDGQPMTRLNELEWTPRGLLANVWGGDTIVLIDLDSGEVIGELDLQGLLPPAERQPETDVLNGIARDPRDGTLWITGKNWPWLYQIKLGGEAEKQ